MKAAKVFHPATACLALLLTHGGAAQSFTIVPVQAFVGRISDEPTSRRVTGVGSYYSGRVDLSDGGDQELRSYFVFNLSGLDSFGPVVSAELDLKGGSINYHGGSNGTVGLFDVTAPISFLVRPSYNESYFADLGTGVSFGEAVLPAGLHETSRFSFPLSTAGIAAVNEAMGTGFFVVGARLLGVDGGIGLSTNQYVFGSTAAQQDYQLVLTDAGGNTLRLIDDYPNIPEPSGYAVLTVAGLGIWVASRRLQRKA